MVEGVTDEQDSDPSLRQVAEPFEFGEKTAVSLRDSASKSFDRFNELDESVWRSLPFFAAVFGFAATLIGTAIPDLPRFDTPVFAAFTHALLMLSTFSFAWAFRWFVAIIKRRSYEYPAEDSDVRSFAESLTAYHAQQGVDVADLDAKVVHELIVIEGAQLADAARLNGLNARERLNARSLTLQFLMVGFGLALANSITIFVHSRIYDTVPQIEKGASNDAQNQPVGTAEPVDSSTGARASDATTGQRRNSGREFLDDNDQSGNAQKERSVTEATPTPPTPPAAVPKPVAPLPQRVERSDPTPTERR
jgi:hypothetical protein